MRHVLIAAVVTLTAAAVLAAPLDQGRALAIMHDRHEGMENVGKANKAASRELQGGSPNLGVVRSSAATLAGLSRQASNWFPAGTGPDVGKTRAKPEIWQNPQDFAAKLSAFQKASQAFHATAAGGDLNAIHASFANLGQSCKACHDKYRAEEKH
jgi:cytochrome c556